MITAEINGIKVTYHGGRWAADDPVLLDTLEILESAYWTGSVRHAPDRDRAIVDFVIAEIGGRVISADEPAGDDAPGRVFY